MFDLFIWAAGAHGFGSSIVAKSIIKALIESSHSSTDILLVAPKHILSDSKIFMHSNVKIILYPAFLSHPVFYLLLKLFLPIRFFCSKLVVLDDFPFLLMSNQLLYFQQALLIYPHTLPQLLKSFTFRFLLLSRPYIFCQTLHIYNSFLSRITYSPSRISQIYHFPTL